MLTEAEARELLARAADTIEVPPGAPVLAPERSSRWRWMPLVAATAPVVLIVVGLALWQDKETTRPTPGDRSPTQDVVQPGADGRIPSVFAYSAEAGEDMFTGLGLTVTIKPEYTCLSAGRADHTKPGPGARFEPGDAVTLFVTEPSPVANCVSPAPQALAWQLLDFANGRGLAPSFSSEVVVWFNGERTVLTGEEAADNGSWGPESALGQLAAATHQELRMGDRSLTPVLTVDPVRTQFVCGGEGLPDELAGRGSMWLSISINTDGFGQCAFANLYQTGGQIDAVVVRTMGLFEAPGDTEPEADPDPDGIGARFLAFARGEAHALPVDTPVGLYLGGQYQKTIDPADVDDPTAWELCAEYAGRSCPMSALTTLAEFEADPAVTDFLPDGCLDPGSAQSPTDTGGSTMVVLGIPEPRTCAADFEVQIWSNDVGQIVAVNLLFGTNR